MLTAMTPKADALSTARRILATVAGKVFAGMGDKKLTISIGIADMSSPGISWSRRPMKLCMK